MKGMLTDVTCGKLLCLQVLHSLGVVPEALIIRTDVLEQSLVMVVLDAAVVQCGIGGRRIIHAG